MHMATSMAVMCIVRECRQLLLLLRCIALYLSSRRVLPLLLQPPPPTGMLSLCSFHCLDDVRLVVVEVVYGGLTLKYGQLGQAGLVQPRQLRHVLYATVGAKLTYTHNTSERKRESAGGRGVGGELAVGRAEVVRC